MMAKKRNGIFHLESMKHVLIVLKKNTKAQEHSWALLFFNAFQAILNSVLQEFAQGVQCVRGQTSD